MANSSSLRDFCLGILESGSLETKLAPPGRRRLDDSTPGPPTTVLRPNRDAGCEMASGALPLPKPGALRQPAARARALARFAHHELQAVELFAFALLRWPEQPAALRRSWLGILVDEQRHCRLYLERLEALDSGFACHAPHSDYFWKHAPALAHATAGPAAFLCVMGLTLEQANLDFSALYQEAFRTVGDDASARVLEQVHRDEVRHVRVAAEWLRRLDPDAPDDIARYRAAVPFPFSAARAKGRRFDRRAREQAGLEASFIDFVQAARPEPPLRADGHED